MKKIYGVLNILLIISILIGDICYMIFGGLWLKAITSAGFVLLGVVNVIFALKNKPNSKAFLLVMLIGLVFGMMGDIVLNVHFMAGAILFAVGHVFYIVAFSISQKFKWQDLIPFAVIFVPSVLFITLAPIFDFGGIVMELICIFYALIISLMVGKAFSNLLSNKCLLNLIIAIGSFLFFFSDLMLLLDVFGGLGRVVGILCLATYYPAQVLLAISLAMKKS